MLSCWLTAVATYKQQQERTSKGSEEEEEEADCGHVNKNVKKWFQLLKYLFYEETKAYNTFLNLIMCWHCLLAKKLQRAHLKPPGDL